MQKAIDEELEKLRREPPDAREVQRALNQVEASFYRRMERVSSKADQLNAYYFAGKPPDWFAQDLARYTSLTAADAQAAIVRWLPADRRVELIVQPEGEAMNRAASCVLQSSLWSVAVSRPPRTSRSVETARAGAGAAN